jgi:hypothetical protein
MSSHLTHLLTINEEEETWVVRCDCFTHLLTLTLFKEDVGEEAGLIYFCIQDLGPHQYNFWWRLRSIWNILWYGKPLGDDLVLRKEVARAVGTKLVELSYWDGEGEVE